MLFFEEIKNKIEDSKEFLVTAFLFLVSFLFIVFLILSFLDSNNEEGIDTTFSPRRAEANFEALVAERLSGKRYSIDFYKERENINEYWLNRIKNKEKIDLENNFNEEVNENRFYWFLEEHPIEALGLLPDDTLKGVIDAKIDDNREVIYYYIKSDNMLTNKKEEETGETLYEFSGEYIGGGFLEDYDSVIGVPIKLFLEEDFEELSLAHLPFEVFYNDNKLNFDSWIISSLVDDSYDVHHEGYAYVVDQDNKDDLYLWLYYGPFKDSKNPYTDINKPITIKYNGNMIWNDVIKPSYISFIPKDKRIVKESDFNNYSLFSLYYAEDEENKEKIPENFIEYEEGLSTDSIWRYIYDKYHNKK